ncbi:MAG: FAD-binding oxidoreductase [Xanthobacteraceae bacterium]
MQTGPDFMSLVDALGAIVGAQHVDASKEARTEFSQDLMEWDDATQVELVVRPGTTMEVVEVVRAAGARGLAVAPRGGGLSYTQGYVPRGHPTIALDLSRLNQVCELNADDRYVTAGAGATWQQIVDAAKEHALRPVLRGPISGSDSTIGGAASQGLLGPTDGFLAFEVVLADGRVITTGSSASPRSLPFYRHFGPDLTGLFTGDTGALGIKTKVTLKLERPPAGLAMASFSFATLPLLVEAIVDITRANLVPRLFGMDPLRARTVSKVGIAEAGRTLGSIASARSSVMHGIADAISVARSGRRALDSADWALHVHAEGVDDRAAQTTLTHIRKICCKNGAEISPNVAIALNARPYSVRGFVGLHGERFVPVHAIFPLSRAAAVAARVEKFFADHEGTFEQQAISTCCLAGMENGVFVIEPMLYWPDQLGPLHRRYLPAAKFARLDRGQPNLEGRKVVVTLRNELRQIFFELGAIHGQIGKYYDFANAVKPEVYQLLTQVKRMLDPECRLNPGNFGWLPSSSEI